ncbi:hypothetical protein GI374_13685 [Paracoccus sp. S-4012]|uniref:hypothetical protein n=1 Tax=Paracoccus sp. S-4012 TaxID=2665648 RepID=UPI001320A4B7|nr:hypothetical protein [Paracoccus sp. S-4012]MRX51471.1 hypothetical protein [Paracoccus sp. S-4012]
MTMLKPILIVLTAAAGGPPHLSLAPAETAEECLGRAAVLGRVLTEAETEIHAIRCGATSLAVEPYVPGAEASAYVHRWRVEIGEDAAEIAPLAEGEACEASEGVFCAVSAQAVIGAE